MAELCEFMIAQGNGCRRGRFIIIQSLWTENTLMRVFGPDQELSVPSAAIGHFDLCRRSCDALRHRIDRRSYSSAPGRAHRAHGSATHGVVFLSSFNISSIYSKALLCLFRIASRRSVSSTRIL